MANKRRVLVADDAANLAQAAQSNGCRVYHEELLTYSSRHGQVIWAGLYCPRHNGMEAERGQLIALKQAGKFTHIEVRPVRGRPDGNYKSDIDTVIALDVWGAAVLDQVDVVMLASGDSDFVPLVERLVARGIEVHVIGPDGATAIELALVASHFVYASQVPGLVRAVGAPGPAVARPAAIAETRDGPTPLTERPGTNGNGSRLPMGQKPG